MRKYSKPLLINVVNSLLPGAIPRILRDLQPEMGGRYKVGIISLEPIASWHDDLDYLDRHGAEVASLNCARSNVAAQYLNLRRYLRAVRPHVVHGHMGRSEVLTPLAAPAGTFSVATYHSMPNSHNAITKLTARATNMRLGARTYVSHAVALAWAGGAYDPSRVIYNPVDASRFNRSTRDRLEVRGKLGISTDTKVFLNVGRLIEAKGQIDLILAIDHLKNRGLKNFEVLIAGEGQLRKELERLKARLNIGEHLRFLGHQSDINTWLSAADVFVFPSHFEGLGLAPLEAMASGCPVIASDFRAGREFLSHKETGYVFPVRDVAALADQMEKAVRDPEELDRCASRAQALVREKFSAPKIAQDYARIYDEGMRGAE